MFNRIKDMPLKKKFQITIVSVIAAFTLLSVVINRFVIYRSFIQFEQMEAVKDLNRGLQTIDREVFHIQSISHEWGSWDDAYIFVQNRNRKFIESNLYYPSFVSANLNIICFLDNNKNIVFTGGFDLKTGKKMLPVFFQENKTIKDSGLLDFKPEIPQNEQNRSGTMITEYGVIVLSARPVLPSANTGPSKGYIIMGRLLTRSVIDKLKDQTKVNFDLKLKPSKPGMSEYAAIFKDLLGSGNAFTMIYQSDKIILYSIYTDVFNKPAFLFQVKYPRHIKTEAIKIVKLTLLYMVLGSMILIYIISYILKRSVLKPIDILKLQVKSIITGDYTSDKVLRNSDELGMLSGVIDDMAGTINRKTTELEDINRVLELLTITDSLTSTFNRRNFDENIRMEWERASRSQEHISLVMCDIDYFKNYNDYYGHQAGDDILIRVAGSLKKSMLRMTDRVYRYGGEEFIIILPDTGIEGSVHIAERLLLSVRKLKIDHLKSDVSDIVTISIGCASTVPQRDMDSSYLVSLTVRALYCAKHNGRNRIIFTGIADDGSLSFTEHKTSDDYLTRLL
jgi:diguanylate cyclase (GGDEF)-like protein